MRHTAIERLGRRTGFVLTGFTAFGLFLTTTALPVILDLRLPLLVVSAAAFVLLALSIRTVHSAVARTVLAGSILAVAATALLMIWDLAFAYRAEQVSFTSADVTLRGTLMLPRGEGPFSAAVFVHGSGAQTRHEHLYYARAYARRGIAALAYDKRGSGASGGSVVTATYEQLAGDVIGAIVMLRQRGDILHDRIGIRAVSEGEWVAPPAAAAINPAFLVLISPSAMTPSEQVRYETGANVLRAGFPPDVAHRARELYGRLAAFQRDGSGREALNEALQHASAEPWFDAARYLEPAVPDYDKVLALDWFPAWRARMDFDALPLLARIDCPVLAMAGGADPKNDGAAALARIEAALAAGGNSAFTGVLYPDAGHGLVEWRLPFGLPPPWLAPGSLEAELQWVSDQLAAR